MHEVVEARMAAVDERPKPNDGVMGGELRDQAGRLAVAVALIHLRGHCLRVLATGKTQGTVRHQPVNQLVSGHHYQSDRAVSSDS